VAAGGGGGEAEWRVWLSRGCGAKQASAVRYPNAWAAVRQLQTRVGRRGVQEPARGAPSHLEKLNRLAMAGRSLVPIACPVLEGGQSGVAFYRSAHCAGLAGSCNGAECPPMSGDTMCVRIRGASM
jgi:hypothetical protein